MVAELPKIENTKEIFFEELFFPIREKSFEPVRRIAERIEIGMLEEANKIAIATDARNGYSSEVA